MRNQLHLAFFLFVTCVFAAGFRAAAGEPDGQHPPPKPPVLKWEDLLEGKLEDHWSDMNTAIKSPTYELKADPDNPKGQVLWIGKAPIGLLRTMKYYENFILDCEWRHLTEAPTAAGGKGTSGNSGLYVWSDPIPTVGGVFARAIEVQVCNLGNGEWYTSHGDIFPIWGAKMKPDPRFGIAKNGERSMPLEFRAKKTGEWNRVRITCVDGTIQQEMNGAAVTGGYRSSPRKGYICVEAEGGPVEFRNMRVHELPGDPEFKEKDAAILWPAGTRSTCLYNGVNLEGVKIAEGQQELWQSAGHTLKCLGKTAGEGASMVLPLKNATGDFTLYVDWTDEQALPFELGGIGAAEGAREGAIEVKKGWNRAVFTYSGGAVTLSVNGKVALETKYKQAGEHAPVLKLKNPGKAVGFSNIMLVEMGKK